MYNGKYRRRKNLPNRGFSIELSFLLEVVMLTIFVPELRDKQTGAIVRPLPLKVASPCGDVKCDCGHHCKKMAVVVDKNGQIVPDSRDAHLMLSDQVSIFYMSGSCAWKTPCGKDAIANYAVRTVPMYDGCNSARLIGEALKIMGKDQKALTQMAA